MPDSPGLDPVTLPCTAQHLPWPHLIIPCSGRAKLPTSSLSSAASEPSTALTAAAPAATLLARLTGHMPDNVSTCCSAAAAAVLSQHPKMSIPAPASSPSKASAAAAARAAATYSISAGRALESNTAAGVLAFAVWAATTLLLRVLLTDALPGRLLAENPSTPGTPGCCAAAASAALAASQSRPRTSSRRSSPTKTNTRVDPCQEDGFQLTAS